MGGRRAGVLCSELCCAQAEGTTLRNRNPVEAWASRLRVRLPRGQTPHSFRTPPTAQSKDRRSKEVNAGDCEEISQRINREQAEGAGGHVHRPFPLFETGMCHGPLRHCAMGAVSGVKKRLSSFEGSPKHSAVPAPWPARPAPLADPHSQGWPCVHLLLLPPRSPQATCAPAPCSLA